MIVAGRLRSFALVPLFALSACAPADEGPAHQTATGVPSAESTAVTAQAGAATSGNERELKKVRVNGVELHYVERGTGEPIIFIHGGLADYREWAATMEPLSQQYRTIAYSRRYNYPNRNSGLRPDHSAAVEAEDLAALIQALDLAPAHAAGFSYGAYTALLLALEHPELLRTLILVEPPVLRWLERLPGGPAAYKRFMRGMWEPAAREFREDDTEGALRVTADYFVGQEGAYDQLPAEFRTALKDNAREWQALTTSSDAFPWVRPGDVQRIMTPTLMLSGEKSYEIGQLIDAELERLLAKEERVIVPEATHETCNENPQFCAGVIRTFLAKHQR